MKVLVLGSDGRAHALVWKLFNSPSLDELVCAPGNGGTSQLVPSADLEITDAPAVARWAFDEAFDIIVPADSGPLYGGVVDEVISFHIGVCGPSMRSTILERSRCRAKEFMLRYNLPTAPGRPFDNLTTAEKYLATQPLPLIVKADHPAGGEKICHERYAALEALRELFEVRPVEGANDGVVIEAYLSGVRVVMSCFTDGRTVVPLLPVRLYDRVEEREEGPLARGVGAHTGISQFAKRLTGYFHEKLLLPIVAALGQESLPYWGLLGIDSIITKEGPRLTALRCSMREGEAQVVLPRLEDDLLPWIQAMIAQRLHELPTPRWAQTPSVGIGLMARGYPYHFPVGGALGGIENLDQGVLVFHSATECATGSRYMPRLSRVTSTSALGWRGGSNGGGLVYTTGGLVATIVAVGGTLTGARGRALINADRITFEGRTYRSDIGAIEFG